MITQEEKRVITTNIIFDSDCREEDIYVDLEHISSENLREDMIIERLNDIIQYVRDGRLTYQIVEKVLLDLENKIK